MGKQKNTKKRLRASRIQRKQALLRKYIAVRDGRIEVDDKKKALEHIAAQLDRRGWDVEQILAERGAK